ncbi:MAG: hypothetical protein L6R37_003626 [Teloschistes peruensis]|nr:MAG: hypothetical protein L6R37_003626 [Teloschistes peruensis]
MSSPSSSKPSTSPSAAPPLSHTTNPTPFRPVFIGILIACPLLAALPPRKLDMYTFLLASAWVVSAEELAVGRASARWWRDRSSITVSAEADRRDTRIITPSQPTIPQPQHTFQQEKREREGEEVAGVTGLARKLWYGNGREGPGWKERRMREEMEALEEGKGYGDLISDAVREVFGGKVGREDVERFKEERRRRKEEEGSNGGS